MPEGFASIDDLKVVINADMEAASKGLEQMRGIIAQFAGEGSRSLGTFDRSVEAVGVRVEWLKGKFQIWITAAEQALALIGKLTGEGDKYAEKIGMTDDWTKLKGAVGELASAVGEGLRMAYDGGKEGALGLATGTRSAAAETTGLAEAAKASAEEVRAQATVVGGEATAAYGEAKQGVMGYALSMEGAKKAAADLNETMKVSADVAKEQARTWNEVLITTLEQAAHSIQRLRAPDLWTDAMAGREIVRLTDDIRQLRRLIDSFSEAERPLLDRWLGWNTLQDRMKELAELEAQLERLGMIGMSKWAEIQKDAEERPAIDLGAATVTADAEKIVAALDRQIRALRQKAEAQRLDAGAAAAYLAEAGVRNQADDQGIAITAQLTGELKAKAAAIGVLAQAEADRKRAEQDEKALERITESLEKQVIQVRRQADALVMGAGAAASAAAEEKALAEARAKGIEVSDRQLTQWRAMAAEIGHATDRAKEMQRQLDMVRGAGQIVASSLTQAFDQWMRGTEIKGRDMVAALLREMAKLTLIKTVLEPAQQGLQGLIGGLLGASGASGAPRFAGGGTMIAGVPSIVGEYGPELVVPKVNSNVIPNYAAGGGSSSVSVNLAVDARGATRDALPELERQMASLQAQLPRIILETVHEGRDRGAIA